MIAAEGEQKASKSLREASEIIAQSPSALQLRYLQVSNITFIRTMPECSHHNFTISHKLHKLYMYDETMER